MQNAIDFGQFRHILHTLEHTDVRIRLRTIGQPWCAFSNVLLLSDSAMILQTNDDQKIIVNIRSVVEFQTEKEISGIEANCIYEVVYNGTL